MARRELSPEEVNKLGLAAPKRLREISPEEEKTLGLDQPQAAPAEAPGVGETLLNRFLNAMAPGTDTFNKLGAEIQSAKAAGVKMDPWSLKLFPDATPEQMAKAQAMKQSQLQAIEARAQAGGAANPLSAAVGNVGGTVAGLAAIPGVGKALGTAGPAAEALSPFLGKWGAKLLTRAAAGGALGGVGAAYKGQDPSEGVGMGLAAGAAPVLSGVGAAASALTPGLSPEERWTRVLGGAVPAAIGASSKLAESVPGLRRLAEENAVRAQGQKIKDIRKAGGVEGAREVGRSLLDEGLIPRVGDAETIGNNARMRKNEVGQNIAEGLDKVNATLPPELQSRLRPFVVAAKVGNDIMPGLEKTAAQRPLIPAGQGVIDDIRAIGGKDQAPMSFAELNRQKTAFGDKAYAAANPFNPSPQADMLQNVYRSLNSHAENVGGEAAQTAGPEALSQWLADKQRYGNLEKASQTGMDASMRGLANRRVSPSDYIVGAGQAAKSGVGLKAALAGAANKALRERGPAFAARGFDDLAGLAGRLPNIWGAAAETPPVGSPPPSAPLPTGALPPTGAPSLPPAGTPTQLPAPDHVPGNAPYNNASKYMYQTLVDRLARNAPYQNEMIVHPETGEVLLPSKLPNEPPFSSFTNVPTPGFSTQNLPPAVRPATSGALEPLSRRVDRGVKWSNNIADVTKNERGLSDPAAILDELLGKTRKRPLNEPPKE